MTNPISVRLAMKTKAKENGGLLELFYSLRDVVLFFNGDYCNFSIEEREVEGEVFYIDILIECMEELMKKKEFFAQSENVYFESDNGELINSKCFEQISLCEVMELTDCEEVYYNPITLEQLQ